MRPPALVTVKYLLKVAGPHSCPRSTGSSFMLLRTGRMFLHSGADPWKPPARGTGEVFPKEKTWGSGLSMHHSVYHQWRTVTSCSAGTGMLLDCVVVCKEAWPQVQQGLTVPASRRPCKAEVGLVPQVFGILFGVGVSCCFH